MLIHRLTALAIVVAFSTVLRVSLIPKLDRLFPPLEGDFSIMAAKATMPRQPPAFTHSGQESSIQPSTKAQLS